jgi:hypothetical protein
VRQRLFRWFDLIGERDKLVRVKSWKPYWDGRHLSWPTILVDQDGYQRRTISPVWDWVRVRSLFKRKGA